MHSFIFLNEMKLSIFGPCFFGIKGEHALIFSPDVCSDGPSWSFEDLLKLKEASVD